VRLIPHGLEGPGFGNQRRSRRSIVELSKTILAQESKLKISGKLTSCQNDIAEIRILKIDKDLVHEAVEGKE
jgi:hypothetical protein